MDENENGDYGERLRTVPPSPTAQAVPSPDTQTARRLASVPVSSSIHAPLSHTRAVPRVPTAIRRASSSRATPSRSALVPVVRRDQRRPSKCAAVPDRPTTTLSSSPPAAHTVQKRLGAHDVGMHAGHLLRRLGRELHRLGAQVHEGRLHRDAFDGEAAFEGRIDRAQRDRLGLAPNRARRLEEISPSDCLHCRRLA